MTHGLLRLALAVLALSAPIAFVGWRAGLGADTRPALAPIVVTINRPVRVNHRTVDSLLAATVASAPFRRARRPTTMAYNPEKAATQGEPAAPPPPKPALVLTGIVLGPEPAAILEGLPGHDGSAVLCEGAVEAGIRVQRISAHAVVLVGMDTTWSLKVRNPWQ